jgi:ferredoxin
MGPVAGPTGTSYLCRERERDLMGNANAARPTSMRLVVDWTRCDGHGLCHTLVPEVVDLDEWGFPIMRDVPLGSDLMPHARRATNACPALALRLERR